MMLCRALALLAALVTPAAASACGASETCSDVSSSYTGTVILDGIRLSWSTDSENEEVYRYKVSRWNGSGWTAQASYYAAQACTYQPYQHTDLSNGDGTYQVAVLDSSQAVVCSYQVAVP